MNTGQIGLMSANVGMTTPGSAQLSPIAILLSGADGQAGGLFAGLLAGMVPVKSPQEAGVPVYVGKDITASDNNGGTAPATGTEQSAEAPVSVNRPGRKPQDVDLNAVGLRMALLTQADGGRMPQAGVMVEQQTVTGADTAVKQTTEGSAETPARADSQGRKPQDVGLNADGLQMALLTQADGGRMPQAGAMVEQQVVAGSETAEKTATEGMVRQQAAVASMTGAQITSSSDLGGVPGIVAVTKVDAGGGLNPSSESLPGYGSSPGASTDATPPDVASRGSDPQFVSQHEPDRTALSARQVSALAGQQNLAAVGSIASTERGITPSNQNGCVSSAVAPVSGTPTPGPGKEGADVRATTFSGVEVTVPPQQAVTMFRSASLEAALAESVPRNEDPVTGYTQSGSSAQTATAVEIPADSAALAAQAGPQQDVSSANSGVMPVEVTPVPASLQRPDQAVTEKIDTLDGTRPVQAAVAPLAGKRGVEAGGDVAQARLESASTAKPVQSGTVEAVKFVGAGSSGEEFSTGDDKGTADNFMNGQFHATAMNLQGNVAGTSMADNVSAPVQNEARQSGLSGQVLQQVKESLLNHEVKAGNDQIVLKLSPENLGTLKMNLSMDGQGLKVEIVAENHVARDALLQNVDSLRESLARQNISMQSFNVTTGNPGQRQQQGDWRESGRQQQNTWMTSAGYETSDTPVATTRLAYQTASPHTMVDLHF